MQDTDKWWCQYEISFGGNEENLIYVQGTYWQQAKKVAIIAVVGGTGIYRNAFGTELVFSDRNFDEATRYFHKLEFTVDVNEEQYKLGVNTPKHFNINDNVEWGRVNVQVKDDEKHNSYGYEAPSYGYEAPSYGYEAPSYGYEAPSYGYEAPSTYEAPRYDAPSSRAIY